jgi:hypothetical protein
MLNQESIFFNQHIKSIIFPINQCNICPLNRNAHSFYGCMHFLSYFRCCLENALGPTLLLSHSQRVSSFWMMKARTKIFYWRAFSTIQYTLLTFSSQRLLRNNFDLLLVLRIDYVYGLLNYNGGQIINVFGIQEILIV